MKTSHRLIALGLCAGAILMSVVGSASATPAWSVHEPPHPPPESTANVIRDVSCPTFISASIYGCIGVGSTTSPSGTKPLLVIGEASFWNTWPESISYTGYPGAVLESIYCVSEMFCEAVGYYTPKAETRKPFAMRMAYESGLYKWTIEKPVVPGADEFTELNGVTCTTSPSYCVAVGTTKATSASTTSKTLIEKVSGGVWSQQTSPSTEGVESRLSDVSCTSGTSCVAVGRVGAGALSEFYNGTEWKQVATGVTGLFESVSCTATTACTAVGQGSGKLIVRRWNGTSWVMQLPVSPTGSTASTGTEVTCRSATECVLVGSYTAEGTVRSLAERWNGTAWSQDTVPLPKGSTSATLLGVSCPASTFCAAVGNSTISGVTTMLVNIYS